MWRPSTLCHGFDGDRETLWVARGSGRLMCLGRLEPFNRHESDFDPLVKRLRNALQHEERVPFVIGVFQAADRRGGSANALGKVPLAEAAALGILCQYAP